METMAQRIRRRRIECGFPSDRALARAGNLNKNVIWRLVNNGSNSRHLTKVAQLLRTTTEWLLYGRDFVREIIAKNIPAPIVDWQVEHDKFQEGLPLMFRLQDDAMTSPTNTLPSFNPPNFIIVAPVRDAVPAGEFVLVKVKDAPQYLFRQLVLEGGIFYLQAINPAYPRIKMDRSIKVCGVQEYELIDRKNQFK